MRKLMHPLVALPAVGAVGAALYGAALAWLWFRQERLLFEPELLGAGEPVSADPDTCEFMVDVPGARLSVAQLKRPGARGVLFYLHGNSGNLRKWFVGLDAFRELDFDVVMMDYRGYGKSSGRIESEQQLAADVLAVWTAVAPQYAGRRVVIAGQSLGTALAAGLAAELCGAGCAPDLTILVSPYSSMRALADEHYPWVPSRVLRYTLPTMDHACRVTSPLMLVHGDKDELIGFHHSEAILRALPQCRLLRIEGAGHGDVHQFPSFRQGLAAALIGLADLAAAPESASYTASGPEPTVAAA